MSSFAISNISWCLFIVWTTLHYGNVCRGKVCFFLRERSLPPFSSHQTQWLLDVMFAIKLQIYNEHKWKFTIRRHFTLQLVRTHIRTHKILCRNAISRRVLRLLSLSGDIRMSKLVHDEDEKKKLSVTRCFLLEATIKLMCRTALVTMKANESLSSRFPPSFEDMFSAATCQEQISGLNFHFDFTMKLNTVEVFHSTTLLNRLLLIRW